jgi:hypothetical protein
MDEKLREADRKPEDDREPYEPPTMHALGTMLELTEANQFHALDLSGLSPASFSDRALKENFGPVDPSAVLEAVRQIPIETWNYTKDDASVRHIGPMAQDFAAAFGVGNDDRMIMAVDANGVCLAAIQALAARVEALEAELAAARVAEPV